MPDANIHWNTMQRTWIIPKAWQYDFLCLPALQDRNKTECEPASSETVAQGDFFIVALPQRSVCVSVI